MKYAIVGRGLIGSAAARHLSKSGHDVCLIGPSEPEDRATHDGVFASHYDEGRITRKLDPNPVWSDLARRSIDRYDGIERESGISFFSEVGGVIAAPEGSEYLSRVEKGLEGVDAACLQGQSLADNFPFLSFPHEIRAYYEASSAGHVSPRKLVAAQTEAARRHGARILNKIVTGVEEQNGIVSIATRDGSVTADKVLIATGGFTNTILNTPLDLTVLGRTISFFELDDEQASELRGMPSIVYRPLEGGDPYILPPIRYPDRKTYLKIGGEPENLDLEGHDALIKWFKSDGLDSAASYQKQIIDGLIPGFRFQNVHTETCVVTYTATGVPYIGPLSDRICVAAGACGAGAKSSDEIGRIAAETLLGRDDVRFPVHFSAETLV